MDAVFRYRRLNQPSVYGNRRRPLARPATPPEQGNFRAQISPFLWGEAVARCASFTIFLISPDPFCARTIAIDNRFYLK
jgi:hypothetical protein